jgi:hypothetical protein
MTSYRFPIALLPEGWVRGVEIDVDAVGVIRSLRRTRATAKWSSPGAVVPGAVSTHRTRRAATRR